MAEPEIKNFEGIGELAVGGLVGSGDLNKLIFTSLALLNDPNLNAYFLANRVKLSDRITKTKIFPREGMALPNGEVYKEETTENTNVA